MSAARKTLRAIVARESVATQLFVRAYAEPRKKRRRPPAAGEPKGASKKRTTRDMLDGHIFVFDTETVEHRLTFAAFEEWRRRKLVARAVFYADTMPTDDPPAFEHLRRICEKLGVRLVSLESIFQQYIWPLRNRGGTICCFNAPYDLSRLCDAWHPATKTARPGSRYCNGVALNHAFTVYDEASEGLREAAPTFARIKRDDRHHVRYDVKNGRVLDLATLAFALTDTNHSVESACRAFGVPYEERPGKHTGIVSEVNVAGCLYDVTKTSELLWALAREYERHPIALTPDAAQSGAAIAKSYLDAFGVQPRLRVQPAFHKRYLGYAAQCYFGGRVECRIVHTLVPCVYLDFASMYPTVFSLLNLWFDHVIPAELEPVEVDPAEVQRLLDAIAESPRLLFDKATWPKLAFFAQVEPSGATLPARVEVPSPHAKSLRNIVVGPVKSKRSLWYAGPDLAAAVITDKPRPRVLRAWRLRPTGTQPTLRPLEFRGEERIDPCTDDFFRVLIEQRKRETGNKLDEALRNTGYKVVANFWLVRRLCRTNPADIDPDAEPTARPVDVYGNRDFTASVNRPETPGRFCFFPTASLVTAGARLLLALGFHEIARAKGHVAYADTDSLVVVSCERGGNVACEGGSERLADGRPAIRALSWKQVETIRNRFSRSTHTVEEPARCSSSKIRTLPRIRSAETSSIFTASQKRSMRSRRSTSAASL